MIKSSTELGIVITFQRYNSWRFDAHLKIPNINVVNSTKIFKKKHAIDKKYDKFS